MEYLGIDRIIRFAEDDKRGADTAVLFQPYPYFTWVVLVPFYCLKQHECGAVQVVTFIGNHSQFRQVVDDKSIQEQVPFVIIYLTEDDFSGCTVSGGPPGRRRDCS